MKQKYLWMKKCQLNRKLKTTIWLEFRLRTKKSFKRQINSRAYRVWLKKSREPQKKLWTCYAIKELCVKINKLESTCKITAYSPHLHIYIFSAKRVYVYICSHSKCSMWWKNNFKHSRWKKSLEWELQVHIIKRVSVLRACGWI